MPPRSLRVSSRGRGLSRPARPARNPVRLIYPTSLHDAKPEGDDVKPPITSKKSRPRSRTRRAVTLLLLLLGLDLLCCAGASAVGGYELLQVRQTLKGPSLTASRSSGLASTVGAVDETMHRAAAAFGVARFCWLPWRPLAAAVALIHPARAAAAIGPLFDIAADGASAGAHVLDGLVPAAAALDGQSTAAASNGVSTRLTSGLVQGRPDLQAGLGDLQAAERAAASLDLAALPRSVRLSLRPLLTLLPSGEQGIRAAIVAPTFLGATRPYYYLLAPQNPLDLRATGGFVGTAVLLRAYHGDLKLVPSQASTDVDSARKTYVAPPLPLLTYQHLSNWSYRDANWSPDYPTTAQLLRLFYHAGQGRWVDGVVAFDSALVPILLDLTGPVSVANPDKKGAFVVLTPTNAIATIDHYVNAVHPGALDKTFAGAVYQTVFHLLIHLHGGQLSRAATLLHGALTDKHLLLWFPNQDVAPLLARQGWAGAVDPTHGVYLYVVDTNVHYNKIDDQVHETIAYHGVLRADRSVASTVTITYVNDASPATLRPPQNNPIDEDFVRVYVPLGSRLHASSGLTQPWTAQRDQGKTLFSGYLRIPSHGRATVTFSYTVLPNAVGAGTSMGLTVQRQPGAAPIPLTVDFSAGARGLHVAGGATSWSWRGTLTQDQHLTIPVSGGSNHPLALAYDAAPVVVAPGAAIDPWTVLPPNL